MPKTGELAEHLVEYDERLARDVLELICDRLGGPAANGDHDVERMRSFLVGVEVAYTRPLARFADVDESAASTLEWKGEFAHYERMRALGLALAELLA